jgi:hypothetical protein
MVSKRTELCQQLLELSELMDHLSMLITLQTSDLSNPNSYPNLFNRQSEWKHKIDIKQRGYARLLQRFNNIKQQLQ